MEAKKLEAIKSYLSFYDAKYYDVQAELIDHFATAIEKYQREDSSLSFKEAFMKAHRAFGGKKGMWTYLDTVEKDVRKKTNRMMLTLLLELLHWPYIAFTAITVLCWHLLFNNLSVDIDLLYLSTVIGGALVIWFINDYRLNKVKMYMPRQANRSLGLILYLGVLLPGNHLIGLNADPSHTLLVSYFSLLTFIYISCLRLPNLAIKETLKQYPQLA